MNAPAVVIEICEAFLERHLSGYQGYPRTAAGVRRFAQALQSNAISVEHLEAILQCFDQEFPTVREINEVATNLRPKYEPKEDIIEKWKRENEGDSAPFNTCPADFMAMHWMAFRDMLYYTEGPGAGLEVFKGDQQGYWWESRKLKMDPEKGHAKTIDFIRNQAREMGWAAIMELSASPVPFPYTNPMDRRRKVKGFRSGEAITQRDVDRAVQERKSTQQVDREAWDDPDR
jgi:hypothetical protein